METEKIALNIIQQLRIIDAITLSEILISPAYNLSWKEGHSARIQAQKILNHLADLGELEKGRGFYRIPGCKSEYSEHSRLLTRALAELLKLPGIEPAIIREEKITNGLIPDALVLIRRRDQGLCFILETAHRETQGYLTAKIKEWQNSEKSLTVLSQIFNQKILHFDIVIDGEFVPEGCYPFRSYLSFLKEVIINETRGSEKRV